MSFLFVYTPGVPLHNQTDVPTQTLPASKPQHTTRLPVGMQLVLSFVVMQWMAFLAIGVVPPGKAPSFPWIMLACGSAFTIVTVVGLWLTRRRTLPWTTYTFPVFIGAVVPLVVGLFAPLWASALFLFVGGWVYFKVMDHLLTEHLQAK